MPPVIMDGLMVPMITVSDMWLILREMSNKTGVFGNE